MKSTTRLLRKSMHRFEHLIASIVIATWSIGALAITPHAELAQSQDSKKPEEEIKDLVVMITNVSIIRSASQTCIKKVCRKGDFMFY